jgi:hypothetical protein
VLPWKGCTIGSAILAADSRLPSIVAYASCEEGGGLRDPSEFGGGRGEEPEHGHVERWEVLNRGDGDGCLSEGCV